MPRPKRPGGPPPKTRSRNGCWPCKRRKVKCDETRPCCKNCAKISHDCDYSLKITWLPGGTKKGGKNNVTNWEPSTVEIKGFEGRFTTISAERQDFHSKSPEYFGAKRRHFDSASPSNQPTDSFLSPPEMDSFPGPASPFDFRSTNSPESTSKRTRASVSSNDSQQGQMPPPRGAFATGLSAPPGFAPSPFSPFSVSTSSFGSPPPTPAASSVTSEDHAQKSPRLKAGTNQMYDGRLSVKSLLGSSIEYRPQQRSFPEPYEDSEHYGFDIGAADIDVPANDDDNAITQSVPTLVDEDLDMVSDLTPDEVGVIPRKKSHQGFGHDIYYSQPVPIKIPNSLGALPSLLLEKPINLLYFHHFINHTARILVPHDCSENPFITLLPQLAFSDSNLLKLLLSYSASHRARLVGQASPRNRIALWTVKVFPDLRHALESSAPISDSNLATAIMLTSLEIISPGAFGHPIPWQKHLGQAREMLVKRGGAASVSREDKTSYFLACWLAYLDVMGSLGGVKNDKPLFSGPYWAETDESSFRVDCLLGFTSHSMGTLAKIADLARKCDIERLELGPIESSSWKPSPATIVAAENLRSELELARTHAYEPCPHLCSASDGENAQNSLEMIATNDAYHWAGLIHIRRRILGSPKNDSEVQNALRQIISSLYKIRKGGTAEACLLFPIFTAACEAEDKGQRVIISERLDCIGQTGMTQPKKAKALVKRVWETGMRWETLADGEFLA